MPQPGGSGAGSGIHPAHVDQVNRLLEAGHKPAAISTKLSPESAKTPGAPPTPQQPGIDASDRAAGEYKSRFYPRNLNATDLQNVHVPLIPTYPLCVGVDDVSRKSALQLVDVVVLREVLRERLCGYSKLLVVVYAWKDQLAIRVDGTFRLCE
jgi:hypothetical protein